MILCRDVTEISKYFWDVLVMMELTILYNLDTWSHITTQLVNMPYDIHPCFLFLYCVRGLCMCEYVQMYVIVHMNKSGANFIELLLCLHVYIGCRKPIYVTRLMHQTPFPSEHLSPFSPRHSRSNAILYICSSRRPVTCSTKL